jgi:hypothetical protein
MKDHILVYEDENATHCFIVGTGDPVAAEKALRAEENVWFGEDESKWAGEIEKRLPFDNFFPTTFLIRGECMTWEDGPEMQPGRGRIAKRPGFIAPLD